MLRGHQLRAFHFRRQVSFGPYYTDFASHTAKLVIEVDGGQHTTDSAIAYDQRRDRFIRAQGYRVLRFTSLDVLNELNGVFVAVLAATGAPID
jgi:very-short-patch-repair endonuclease